MLFFKRTKTHKVTFGKYWFLYAVCIVLYFGFQHPQIAMETKYFLKPLIFIAMFLIGIRQNFSEIVSAIKDFNAISFCMVISYLVSPLIGFFLAKLFFESQNQFFFSIIIGSTVCTTLVSAVVWTTIAKGNESLAIVLSIISSAASIVITPCMLYFFINQTIEIPVIKIAKDFFLFMIPPIIIAQIIRYYCIFDFSKFSKLSSFLGQLIILSTILLATTCFNELRISDIFIILFIALFHFSAVAFFSFQFSALFTSKENSIAIMYCASLKSVPAAALISMTCFEPITSVYILFYHIVQQCMAQIIAKKITLNDDSLVVGQTCGSSNFNPN